jgi:SAM-dependent methyltransferase
MYKEFAEVYDYLAEEKDYKKEVAFCRAYWTEFPKTVLDIGCGTGSHLKEFSEQHSVRGTGVDPCEEMISVARQKDVSKCTFYVGEVFDIEEDQFDVAVSFFNVINHINDYATLRKTFKSIYSKINQGGHFLFDCWNGAAFFIDPPQVKTTVTSQGTYKYTPTVDYLNSNILMDVSLNDEFGKVVNSKLSHTLWTPYFLKSLLLDVGFTSVDIYKHFSLERAVGTEHKLSFVCTK